MWIKWGVRRLAAMNDWRSLILPREHGVWGLLAGAALVGLPLSRDLVGLPLLGSALAGVVLRQALSQPRDAVGRNLVLALAGCIALLGLLATATLAGERSWMPWLVASALVGVMCLRTPAGRPWWFSAGGGVAAGLLAGAIAAAGGAGPGAVAIGAGALAMHLVSSIPLVRSQTRGKAEWVLLAIEVHVIAVLTATGGWAAGLVPAVIPLVFGLGLVRALYLVDKPTRMSGSPARIGLRELAWLPVLAAAVVVGLRGVRC